MGGAGRLVHAEHCIGHGRCAAECPVSAIQLVFGTAKRGVDIPQVGPDFQTNVPGLYIVGALAGYPLIKNCLNQGYEVVERILGNAITPGKGFRNGPFATEVELRELVDMAGGHGLLAQALLLLDDSSPEALVVDPKLPRSAATLRSHSAHAEARQRTPASGSRRRTTTCPDAARKAAAGLLIRVSSADCHNRTSRSRGPEGSR